MSLKSKKTAERHGKPKVSIMSTTYNQEKYIRRALESFVSQKTNFDFEVVIADDCSTDKTPEIIREYAEKYPDIFKAKLRKKNIGPWENYLSVLRDCKGEYIAICEGDDYWTDNNKLQKQADFLDKRPDYALCFHPVKVFFENKEEEEHIYPDTDKKLELTVKGLLKENFIQTNSVMYRRQDYVIMPTRIVPGDWYVHLYHAQFGKIGFINDVMSAYRRHPGGLWWNSYADIAKIWKKYGLAHLALYVEILKLYGKNSSYKEIVNGHIFGMLSALIDTDMKLFEEAIKEVPGSLKDFMINQRKDIKKLEASLEKKTQEANDVKRQLRQKDHLLEARETELRDIKSSKAWKLRNKGAKIVGKKVIE